MSRLAFIVPLLALVATASVADTSNGYKPAAATVASFESLDRNADHRLSRSEAGFDRVLSEVFADSDVDGDGFVTRSEYDATLAKRKYSVAAR